MNDNADEINDEKPTPEGEIKRLRRVIESYAASSAAAAKEIRMLRDSSVLTPEESEAVQWAANLLLEEGFTEKAAWLRSVANRLTRRAL